MPQSGSAGVARKVPLALAELWQALILPGVAGKTPGQLRIAIARAVTAVNPAAALARREKARRLHAQVELWREDAGIAVLCGRDLPPADALAADRRITAYARDLKAAGLDGTLDQLRTCAFLDLTLGVRSHPPDPGDPGAPAATQETSDIPGSGNGTAGGGGTGKESASSTGSGIAARINLTIPSTTLLGLAERPGEASGLGAIDPALALILAHSAATNPRTTWCVTVTDDDGHPTAHGCARPASRRPAGRFLGRDGTTTMEFTTTLQLDGKTATGIRVPDEAVAALGGGKRIPVSVTINGTRYASTITTMRGEPKIQVSADIRSSAGIAAGDSITVQLERDDAPRTVDLPAELADALRTDPAASDRFAALSYSNQRRQVLSITGARTAETRTRRIQRVLDELRTS